MCEAECSADTRSNSSATRRGVVWTLNRFRRYWPEAERTSPWIIVNLPEWVWSDEHVGAQTELSIRRYVAQHVETRGREARGSGGEQKQVM